MVDISCIRLSEDNYPVLLANIPNPPRQLFYRGSLDTLTTGVKLAVVGSRKYSPYGCGVTHQLVTEIARNGVVIVSGLALGIDGLAHAAALDAGGATVAVLPCGLDKVYPSTHRQLAERILQQGGSLISEYDTGTPPLLQNFVARNRIVSGLCNAILVIEAAEKSGTLHTANFALEQGRTVMAVPGNITSQLSAGTNNLIKSGATPVTCAADILNALGISESPSNKRSILAANAEESVLLQLLLRGTSDASELLALSEFSPALFNQTLTMMEITGKIRPLGAGHWTLN